MDPCKLRSLHISNSYYGILTRQMDHSQHVSIRYLATCSLALISGHDTCRDTWETALDWLDHINMLGV